MEKRCWVSLLIVSLLVYFSYFCYCSCLAQLKRPLVGLWYLTVAFFIITLKVKHLSHSSPIYGVLYNILQPLLTLVPLKANKIAQ